MAWLAAAGVMLLAVATTLLARRGARRALAEKEAALAESRRALEQARENEATMRLALDAASEFLWDGDLITGKVTGSPQAGRWLGYTPEEWPPDPWFNIVHEDDRALVNDAIRKALKGTTRTYWVRHRLRHKDGSVLHALSTGVVIRDPSGKPARFVGFVRDLTREAQEETHRLQAQKLESLGLLAGGIAHDFNNVLTAITTSLALSSAARSLEESKQPLETALEAAGRATMLTRQLLSYAGRSPIAFGPVDLNELIRSMAQLLNISVSRRATLELDLSREPIAVKGEPSQLQQVVLNLVTNAAEACGERGTVTVRTRVSGEGGARRAQLVVRDTGSGIPAELQTRIFDPFFSTKGASRGLGLGVIAGIVKSHGGTIAVESALGQGSTFTIELSAVDVPVKPANAGVAQAKQGFDLDVLLVDDEAIVRKGVRRLLERLGCRVDDVESGSEAVELVRAKPDRWDFVLMDVSMPQMTGTEAAELIRPLAPSLPIVLTSGFSTETPATGPHLHFLPKPYQLEELEAVLTLMSK